MERLIKTILIITNFFKGLLFLPSVLVLTLCLLFLLSRFSIGSYIALLFLIVGGILWIRELVLAWKNKRRIFVVGLTVGFLLIVASYYFFIDYPQYPDRDKTIAQLEQYRREHTHYPETLDALGLKVDTEWVRYTSYPKESAFWLCYVYPTPVGTDWSCYDSKTGKWEAR